MDRTRFLIQTHPKEALLTPKRENQVFVTVDPRSVKSRYRILQIWGLCFELLLVRMESIAGQILYH